MSIYTQEFPPTYLYIKQHSITGKLYFGKTTKDPEKYLGSGTHWCRHIKKHSKEHVLTLWYCLFFDKETISEFALMFSEQQSIVEIGQWLNLKPENGLDGGCPGETQGPHSDETKLKMSIARIGKPGTPHSDETKLKLTIGNTGRKLSKESKLKMSIAHKGVKQLVVMCPHCGKSGGCNAMKQWHFENCKRQKTQLSL